MKLLVVVVGLCAYASASIAPLGVGHGLLYAGAYGYPGPQHLPVIGPNGVPLEPPANVAARAQHAAAVVEAKARNGDLYAHGLGLAGLGGLGYGNALGLGAPALGLGIPALGLGALGIAGHGAYAYGGPQHIPVIGPNGVPLEPAANVAARAQHAHAVAEAQARNGDLYGHGHLWRKRRSIGYAVPAAAHGIPVIGPNGVPLELPANVAARAQHAVAVANAVAGAGVHGAGLGLGPYGLGAAGLVGPYGYGLAGAGIAPLAVHGVPQDTHEVAAAKAAHFAAHAEANARNGLGWAGHNGLGLGASHGAWW